MCYVQNQSSLLLIKYCASSCKFKLPNFSYFLLSNNKRFKRLWPVDWKHLINLSTLKQCSLAAFAGNTRITFTNVMTSLINLSRISVKLFKCVCMDSSNGLISTPASNLAARSKGPLWNNFIPTTQIDTATVKTDL